MDTRNLTALNLRIGGDLQNMAVDRRTNRPLTRTVANQLSGRSR